MVSVQGSRTAFQGCGSSGVSGWSGSPDVRSRPLPATANTKCEGSCRSDLRPYLRRQAVLDPTARCRKPKSVRHDGFEALVSRSRLGCDAEDEPRRPSDVGGEPGPWRSRCRTATR